MSAQAALDARRAVDNALTVVAVELLCGAQAAEFVAEAPEVAPDDDHATGTGAVYEAVREVVPPLVEDRPVHEDVARVDTLVRSGLLAEALVDALDEPLE